MYQDNLLEIQNLQLKIKSLEVFVRMMRDPDFDSFDFLYEGFSKEMSKEDVENYLRTREKEAEEDLAGLLADNAISRVSTAIDVIEAQSALLTDSDTDEENEVEPSLEADKNFITALFDKARKDSSIAQKNTDDSKAIQEVYIGPLAKSADRLDYISKEGVSPLIGRLDREGAIQQIANGRLEFAELDIERLHFQAGFAETKIHHAIFLRKSMEVGITPTANIEDEINQRLHDAETILKECKGRIPQVMMYMNAVREMAPQPQSPTNFDAKTYIPLPLSLLSP